MGCLERLARSHLINISLIPIWAIRGYKLGANRS
jgi:hypothetical protein